MFGKLFSIFSSKYEYKLEETYICPLSGAIDIEMQDETFSSYYRAKRMGNKLSRLAFYNGFNVSYKIIKVEKQ